MIILQQFDQIEESRKLFSRSFALYQALNDSWGIVDTLFWQSNAYRIEAAESDEAEGCFQRASEYAQEADAIARELGNIPRIAQIGTMLSEIALDMCHYAQCLQAGYKNLLL